MAYKPTTWIENETPLSAENMNNIEEGIQELKAGGVIKGLITAQKGIINHSWASGTNQQGYLHIATITIPASHMDSPIEFDVFTRNANRSTKVSIIFNGASGSDPSLKSFTKIGPHNVYIYKSATSTWKLYVQTKSVYEMIVVANLTFGQQFVSKANTFIAWEKGFVAAMFSNAVEAKVATVDMVATGIEGVTVWQNASPGGVFGATTISLSLDKTYSKYEIIYFSTYNGSFADSVLKTTGILPFGTKCNLSDVYPLTSTGTLVNMARKATATATQIVFEDAIVPDATVGVGWYCIPYKVIFYP